MESNFKREEEMKKEEKDIIILMIRSVVREILADEGVYQIINRKYTWSEQLERYFK